MYLRAVTECGLRRTVSLSYFHVRLIIGSKTSPSTVVKIHTSTGIVLNRVIQFKVISLDYLFRGKETFTVYGVWKRPCLIWEERWANLRLTLSNTELKFFSKCSQSSFVISWTLNEKYQRILPKRKQRMIDFWSFFNNTGVYRKSFPNLFVKL